MTYRTEDQVRQSAKILLGFDDKEPKVSQDVGQVTTFNELGFRDIEGKDYKPDGWYLPDNTNATAIILKIKSSKIKINNDKLVKDLMKYYEVVKTKYRNVVSIIYNGQAIRVFKNQIEVVDTLPELKHKNYYLSLFNKNTIDKQKIYTYTKRINDLLHFKMGIQNLNYRMIFTACSLVAKQFGANFNKGMSYPMFKLAVVSKLEESLEEDAHVNNKLKVLLETYNQIKPNTTFEQTDMDNFIDYIEEISDSIQSDYWNGEDVMGIFFNEFNRYKSKPDLGQVFTPDNITSLMYRLIEISPNDRVLDACAGSGAFVVKAMSNMIQQAGGNQTKKAQEIKSNQIYAIEYDHEIFALLAANFLIHKDGKTNITIMDSRQESTGQWIKEKRINKVLMNPPYERKYGCMEIVENVLDSVEPHSACAFLLPDGQLEKHRSSTLLKKHRVKKIIKIPENTFSEGVVTSIFIFESGVPQSDHEIFTCYIEEDGLETVKNQGRQDINNKWKDIEDPWVEIIHKQHGHDSIKWENPKEHLSYQMPQKELVLTESDFKRTMIDYIMFQRGIDPKEFNDSLLNKVLFNSEVEETGDEISNTLTKEVA